MAVAPQTPTPTPEKSKRTPDWERIEAQYRAGTMSVREVATEHGISHTAIQKRAKAHGWTRNLKARVQAKADELVARASAVANSVATETPTEREQVDVEAQVQSRIRLSHRHDIGRSRSLVMRLLSELEAQTDSPELLASLGAMMAKPDERGVDKLNDLYQKVISLSSRTGTMKSLAESLKNLVGLEREAYGLATAGGTDDPLAELLGAMRRSALPVNQCPDPE